MRYLIFVLLLSTAAFSQVPPIEPGVSQELAKWRAAHYSDVRYKLNLTLERMSPVLKGTIEIRVNVQLVPRGTHSSTGPKTFGPIILDWRRIKGHEDKSTIVNVTINGLPSLPEFDGTVPKRAVLYSLIDEHLIFRDGVKPGENVIKLDFTSPILASGSAITRYIDKEDGSEYIYSLFVPSDASTAFPVFDQPDLKAKYTLSIEVPFEWDVVSNAQLQSYPSSPHAPVEGQVETISFQETQSISSYVFAFAAGDFDIFSEFPDEKRPEKWFEYNVFGSPDAARVFVRRSQAAKFQPHAAEVFRLNRESVKYFEEYFDYKFPFPKYDLVLIPEFPFGGMEHAGATYLRESAIIFPQEPTKSDHISRAVLIFHEAAHQWFGDTVTMKWFDDLWLKEGFANFMAYKAVERIMPEANAWKVFYERIKQPAYATDSTRGTTPIYQPIDNLNSAKSAYGNIVYNKAPAFLKQAEFYLGPEKFQTAVRAFLKKHEYKNARWSDLVDEFSNAEIRSVSNPEFLKSPSYPKWKQSTIESMKEWAENWVTRPGLSVVRYEPIRLRYRDVPGSSIDGFAIKQDGRDGFLWRQSIETISINADGERTKKDWVFTSTLIDRPAYTEAQPNNSFFFPNSGDHGYGIFLLDDKSSDYVRKNVQNEKDAFLRSMMYGALWDSVREGELDPRAYVEVAIKNLEGEQDETIAQMMLSRTATALGYYLSEPPAVAGGLSNGTTNSTGQRTVNTKAINSSAQPPATAGGSDLRTRFESVLIDRIKNAPTLGQRITFFRMFVANATTESSRAELKAMLKGRNLSGSEGAPQQTSTPKGTLPTGRVSGANDVPVLRNATAALTLRTKDKFDIVTRLAALNDPDATKLLAELEKTETSDDAKRYAYAARAAFPTKENREKYWNDFINNKDISESWIEAAFGPFNSVRNSELSLPYLKRALEELPNHKRSRKIFFVNGWLAAFIGGQRSQEALDIVNKFLTDNPNLDKDLRLKILENVDIVERAVRIRAKYK